MIDRGDLRTSRQQLIEMDSPPSRVLALAQSEHTRAVEDLFEPAAQPICSLGLGAPKRLKHAEHERRIDSFNRQLPDDGVDELADCVLPRGQAPGAAPSRLAGLNIVLRGCSKVVALAAATLASCAARRFSARGSRPSRNCSRRAVALRRAFFERYVSRLPNPISRSRPPLRVRNTHDRPLPFGETAR